MDSCGGRCPVEGRGATRSLIRPHADARLCLRGSPPHPTPPPPLGFMAPRVQDREFHSLIVASEIGKGQRIVVQREHAWGEEEEGEEEITPWVPPPPGLSISHATSCHSHHSPVR